MNKRVLSIWGSLPFLAYIGMAHAAMEINFQTPQTEIARQIYSLHMWLLYIIVAICLIVFGAMFYAIFRYRKSKGHQAAHFHENTTVEIIWTVIPILILIGMAFPATKTILAMKDTRGADLTVKVTGYQWRWGYDYLDSGVSFISRLTTPQSQIDHIKQAAFEAKSPNYLLEVDNPMVVPVGKKVRLLTTADDVIHSWWIPAFGVKQDAIPGLVRDTWFQVDKPGIYRGQCAELCGKDHAFMPIVVQAVMPEQFEQWLESEKKRIQAAMDDPNKVWSLSDMINRGQTVYTANCVACHQANGQGIPGTFPALDGADMVVKDKAAHIDMVMNGSRKNPAMVAWMRQLSDTEIAAVVTYERNAWSNKTGDLILPNEIAALRNKK
jgi:cytochrome c oxidase subunit 2